MLAFYFSLGLGPRNVVVICIYELYVSSLKVYRIYCIAGNVELTIYVDMHGILAFF